MTAPEPVVARFDENGVVEPSPRTPDTIALADAIAMKSRVGNVPLPADGEAAGLLMQLGIFKEQFFRSVERIPGLGGEWRDREVQQAAVLAKQYELTRPMYEAARAREDGENQRKREQEEAREQRKLEELQEIERLRRIALGLA